MVHIRDLNTKDAQLFAVLQTLCKQEALSIVRGAGRHKGLEAWRRPLRPQHWGKAQGFAEERAEPTGDPIDVADEEALDGVVALTSALWRTASCLGPPRPCTHAIALPDPCDYSSMIAKNMAPDSLYSHCIGYLA